MEYDEQLDRALEETPEIEDASKRFQVPDPTLRTEGSATIFENFRDVLDRLGREEDHVVRFLQTELGTSAQIDESGRARFTGSFRQNRIEEAMDAYADEYVICSECGLPDTNLVDEQGTTMLKCDACGALSSVPEI